ncbi:MAG: Eco47II family restriction endonuclease, partial [Christensenellaceae bacterium]|nr:Eco47II family restriction endonuclease [Christensenellaceae bacterium]
MSWDIDFISRENFKNHIKKTIANYGSKLESFNLEKFNKNTIDPIKMIFDKAVYGEDWKTIISNEIFRQRDKSNTNEIGYFHQKFFTYIKNCTIPQKGWDVIFKPQNGYILGNGNKIKTIYVEMKNKHNTMNSASSSKTYMKMQSQLLDDDTCACFLVEAIAKRSQDITWSTTINDKKSSHN